MNVIFDPRNRMLYASYYIYGIRKAVGRKNVSFSISPFKDLDRECDTFDKYMAFIVNDKGKEIKMIVDYWDLRGISEKAYKWCDVYAKINISFDINMEDYPKLCSIPPGFGIKADNLLMIMWLCIANFFRCHCNPLRGLRSHLYDYYAAFRGQEALSFYYSKQKVNSNYVFLISTLWPHDNCVKTTNPLRMSFMKTCIADPNVEFEGGFYVKGEAPEEYQELSFHKFVKKRDYLNKIKRSVVVFNTPAVHDCHGWKLGEYLAMGKCIISTPLSNRLPEKLKDRQHIFVVNSQDDMRDAVEYLLANNNLRMEMSRRCKDYFEKYAEPTSIFRMMMEHYELVKSINVQYNN